MFANTRSRNMFDFEVSAAYIAASGANSKAVRRIWEKEGGRKRASELHILFVIFLS
jgi:hypothetical protein